MTSLVRRLAVVVVALALFWAWGCGVAIGDLEAQASDSWTHAYPLTSGGEIEVVNGNGRIEVEGVEGSTVEVLAERVAKGATEQAARDLLPRIGITEEASPDRVSIRTNRIEGFLLGVRYEVRYHVKAPRNALVRVTNTNGAVVVRALNGRVVAHTTNGGVTGTDLAGGVDARATNGGVNIEIASLGPERVELRTTNGGVTLTLPETSRADVSASCTNGGIDVSGVKFETVGEASRRHLEGRLNGGGTPIELRTTNGGIRLRNRT